MLPPRRAHADAAVELCAEGDVFHDYILQAYTPLAPSAGKLRSVNLLHRSFDAAGVGDEGRALVERVRAWLGPFRTVWGVKHDDEGRQLKGWELYFYDWERAHADLSIAALREHLAPLLRVDAVEPRPLPWHMISVEFSPAQLRAAAAVPVDVYIDMRSYKLRGDALDFENIYTFHDPRAEIDDVLRRLRASVHLDVARDSLGHLLPPRLLRCHRVCVANKRRNDALYFSRIPTPALRWFLRSRGYPEVLYSMLDDEAARLDHLLWDAGLDFASSGGAPVIRRSGFYGSF